jgi:hypothetical protein
LAFRSVTVVQVVLVFAQAAFAGQFLSGNGPALNWHALNADLILLVGLAQIGLAVVVWRRGAPAWPIVASALLWFAAFAQMVVGYMRRLDVHIPLGVAILGLSVALLFSLRAPRSAANGD